MTTNEIQDLLIPLANGQNLTFDQAARAFQIMMAGSATPAQMAAFLMGLRQKGETVDEIAAGASVMRAKAEKLNVPQGTIDTCGTGGDSKGTLNVSTAAALAVAACGVPVAKHGNRAVTSSCGSADVLKELDVNIEAGRAVVERCVAECNIGFMLATRFHAATRHVAPVRVELGLRTIFNLLGPLANPAQLEYQLIGVYDKKWLPVIASVLHALEMKKAWVVHGRDGTDEISITGPTDIAILENGMITEKVVTPEEAGLETGTLEAIKGGDALTNARAISELLSGKESVYADIVALNAAACLMIAGKTKELKEGVQMARSAIANGKAKETLANLVRLSKG